MLAQVADVEARLGRPITSDETARVEAFLEDASALIEDYCGKDFSYHINETFTLDPTCSFRIEIPPRFRINLTISSVSVDGVVVTDWTKKGDYLYRDAGWDGDVVVTASWGYETTPASLKAVVCAEVVRWLSVAPGVSRERVGELEQEFTGSSTVQNLSNACQESLKRWRRKAATVSLGRPNTLPSLGTWC